MVVTLALGIAGGWVLFERDEEDEQAPGGWNTCVNPVEGYSIDYPPGWHTDHREPKTACVFFDPRPFELPPELNWPVRPMQVLIGESFEQTVRGATRESIVRVLQREEVQLDAGRAMRLETQALQGSEFGGPAVRYMYVIDRPPNVLTVQTSNSPGVDFDAWKAVVDRAARSVRFTARRQVVGLDVPPEPRGLPLPQPVITKRAEIWAAARGKDYDSLARLVDDEGFEYTFGGPYPGGPTAYWRSIERRERPLDVLAAILQLPHVYEPQSKLYIWPDAFTRKPDLMTAAEKAELAAAVGEQVVAAYEQLDGYLGYRAGIDSEGNWVFYVAGD